MQRINKEDFITRLSSHIQAEDQEVIHIVQGRLQEFYELRRASESERRFWNQFWHSWDFMHLRDAHHQAHSDMVSDPNIRNLQVPKTVNFEKMVAYDQWSTYYLKEFSQYREPTDLYYELFYNYQNYVQECLKGRRLEFTEQDAIESLLHYEPLKTNKENTNQEVGIRILTDR